MTNTEVKNLLVKSASIIRELVAENHALREEKTVKQAGALVDKLKTHGLISESDQNAKLAELSSSKEAIVAAEQALTYVEHSKVASTAFSLTGEGDPNETHPFESFLMGRG